MTPLGRTEKTRTDTKNAAFSLRDLCIVVALVTCVVAVQLPSIAHNNSASSATTCRNNHRHLIQAWLMYADDNFGRLAPNNGDYFDGTHPTVVAGWLDGTSSPNNTNTTYLVDPELHDNHAALLGPYLGRNPSYFRCPADRSTTTIAGQRFARVRSVSMNNWVGGIAWSNDNRYRVYRNESEIGAPGNKWVMTDERPDSINDFLLNVQMGEDIIISYPGSFHSSGTWFSYADGHVDYKRWTTAELTRPYVVGRFLSLGIQPGKEDWTWLTERTTESR